MGSQKNGDQFGKRDEEGIRCSRRCWEMNDRCFVWVRFLFALAGPGKEEADSCVVVG